MVLEKLAKTGTILLSGVLLGSLLNYNSQKTEIVDGINNIKSTAIQYKGEVSNLKSQKDRLES